MIGGVAAQLHGWRGATLDLDISIAVEEANRARLERALVRLRARQIGIGPNGTAFTTRFGRLEIVSRADGIGRYEHWKASAVRYRLDERFTVLVASPGDVLRSKEAAGREKDRAVLSAMRDDFLRSGALKPD